MTIAEALEKLGSKTIITVNNARAICVLIDVPFDEKIIMQWEFRRGEEMDFYKARGFTPFKYGPGEGVDCLTLSYKICELLNIVDENGNAPGFRYSGAGYQARANSQAIAQYFSQQEVKHE